jgi:hypothetical protein
LKIVAAINKNITPGIPPIAESVSVCALILGPMPKKPPTYFAANSVIIPCAAVRKSTEKKRFVLIIEAIIASPATANKQYIAVFIFVTPLVNFMLTTA